MKTRMPPKPKRLPAAKQRLMDELLEKNGEGTITSVEAAKLKGLVADAEQLMVENAKRLAAFHECETTEAPVGAVPVIVWVKPAHSGR